MDFLNQREGGMVFYQVFLLYSVQHRVGRVQAFLQSSELGLPQPLTHRRVCPPPLWFRGEGHTGWQERGWDSRNSDEETYTVVLYISEVGKMKIVNLLPLSLSSA